MVSLKDEKLLDCSYKKKISYSKEIHKNKLQKVLKEIKLIKKQSSKELSIQ